MDRCEQGIWIAGALTTGVPKHAHGFYVTRFFVPFGVSLLKKGRHSSREEVFGVPR